MYKNKYSQNLKASKTSGKNDIECRHTTPSQNVFSELNWLTFLKRVQYHSWTMVYKAINDLASEYISDIVTKVSDSHIRNLRSVNNNLLPSSKTSFYENSFTISAAKQWNELPLDIRNSSIECTEDVLTQ